MAWSAAVLVVIVGCCALASSGERIEADVACGKECTYNFNCGPYCTLCHEKVCVTSGQCGAFCNNYTDCLNSSCERCSQGSCASSACGGYCVTDDDCDFPGTTCGSCILNACVAPVCLIACGNDTDCSHGTTDCITCHAAKCTASCGGACQSDSDCNGRLTGCGTCQDGKCSVGECGAECAFSNNQCDSLGLCTWCNFTGSCSVGLECGCPCNVDSDCDASSACSLCTMGTCGGKPQTQCVNHCTQYNAEGCESCASDPQCVWCLGTTGLTSCVLRSPLTDGPWHAQCNSSFNTNSSCQPIAPASPPPSDPPSPLTTTASSGSSGPTSIMSLSTTAAGTDSGDDHGKLSPGDKNLIIGVASAFGAFFAVVFIIAFCCWYRRRKRLASRRSGQYQQILASKNDTQVAAAYSLGNSGVPPGHPPPYTRVSGEVPDFMLASTPPAPSTPINSPPARVVPMKKPPPPSAPPPASLIAAAGRGAGAGAGAGEMTNPISSPTNYGSINAAPRGQI